MAEKGRLNFKKEFLVFGCKVFWAQRCDYFYGV